MRVKPYIARARKDINGTVTPKVYHDGPVCGLQFFNPEGRVVHDTGARFRGREAREMALRGAHFILEGERIKGGREGL